MDLKSLKLNSLLNLLRVEAASNIDEGQVIAPKASVEVACVLMQIGDCDYGVCGYCNAFDLVTVRKLGWLL